VTLSTDQTTLSVPASVTSPLGQFGVALRQMR
jgi:hypothetical protein